MNLVSMSWIIPKCVNLKVYFRNTYILLKLYTKVFQKHLNFKQFQN